MFGAGPFSSLPFSTAPAATVYRTLLFILQYCEAQVFKNVASQKITLFAFDSATGMAKTGDSANITAYVAKDDGTVTVLGDTSSTETDATNAKGDYLFDLTQAETNADKLRFSGKSSTSGIVIVPVTIYTLPNRFSTLVIDTVGLADVNTVKIGPTGAGVATTANLGTNLKTIFDTDYATVYNASNKGFNISNLFGTALSESAGAGKLAGAFVKMFNVATPTGTVNSLPDAVAGAASGISIVGSAMTLAANQHVIVDSGTVTTLTNLPAITAGWLTATGIAADAITAAKIADGAIDTATFASGTTIPRCTLVDTLTTYTGNTVQTGDSFARIGVNGAGLTNIDLPDQTMNITGNITGNLSGSVGSVTGLTASNLDATVSSRLASSSYTVPPTAAANATAVAAIDVSGQTLNDALRIIGAAVAGESSGVGTATEAYLDFAGASCYQVTFDASNNRTITTYA